MLDTVLPILRKHWGYDSFRPLQAEAIDSVLTRRDSLVVLPTGGGKSLCYQAPILAMRGTAVVVSPLLSLMKDQTDALRECGVPAACLNSMQSAPEQRGVADELKSGRVKLLYVAPERLGAGGFTNMLRALNPTFFAIDEAHCISTWGHEFRPDYRRLALLRREFPDAGIHAFTATATRRVRQDIATQLGLRDPTVLVGSFDRPNLTYRVERRVKKWDQICSVIERHPGESGIIYCISRRNVDDLCGSLRDAGCRALPYHAGLENTDRQRNQNAFLRDETDIIVATVAFGMGIDKSNVRYVIHAGAPKTLENYQQEAGRSGRDGLPSECVLLWSPGDFILWKRMMNELVPDVRAAALQKLKLMSRFCESSVCRHKALVRNFDQDYEPSNCGACDICLSEQDAFADPLITAQKILSCVVRLRRPESPDYLANVLIGTRDPQIAQSGDNRLSTYGILSDADVHAVRDWIEQLQAQKLLEHDSDGRILQVTDKGWSVLRGQNSPRLRQTPLRAGQSAAVPQQELSGVDRELFESLRKLRRALADERNVPAFVVFSDATLRDIALKRPGTLAAFLKISGVGEKKCREFGRQFLQCIVQWCERKKLPTDLTSKPVLTDSRVDIPPKPISSDAQRRAFALFEKGLALEDVAAQVGRASATVAGYLDDYINRNRIDSPSPWVDDQTFIKVRAAVERVGIERLKPLFDDLGESISYDSIRICRACLRNRARKGLGRRRS